MPLPALCWQTYLRKGRSGTQASQFPFSIPKLAKFIAQIEPELCTNVLIGKLGKEYLVKRKKTVIQNR